MDKINYNTLNTINIRRIMIKESTIHTQYKKYQENKNKRNYTLNTINIKRIRIKETTIHSIQ